MAQARVRKQALDWVVHRSTVPPRGGKLSPGAGNCRKTSQD